MIEVLLLTHAAATLVMVGVIWFVQIVHYPLMARVSAGEFAAYEREHQTRITLVVAPTMLAEAATAALIIALPPPGLRLFLPVVGICLLAVIWLSTFFAQVPLHARLAKGFDAVTHRRLVLSNWLRTAAWTGRGILALVMLTAVQAASPPSPSGRPDRSSHFGGNNGEVPGALTVVLPQPSKLALSSAGRSGLWLSRRLVRRRRNGRREPAGSHLRSRAHPSIW